MFVAPWAIEADQVATSESARTVPSTPPLSSSSPLLAPEATELQSLSRRAARPVLADRFKQEWRALLSIGDETNPAFAEQFRRLAATLIQQQRTAQLKSILVTSAVPSEGKTLTALNLGLILSESYRRRVLIIDADLRKPAISGAVNLSTVQGLSEAIHAPEDRKVTLVQLTDTLTFLPAGRPHNDPVSGLTSPRMSRLIEEACTRFDWVIVDSPPIGAAADAGLLCPMLDAALVVIRADRTPHAAIQRAIDALGRERILGLVLNGADGRLVAGDSKYSYEYAYGYGTDPSKGEDQ